MEVISISGIPKSANPLSLAVKAGDLIFISGRTGQGDTIEAECRAVMESLKMVVEAAGARMDQVVKTLCFLVDLKDKEAFNKVYGEYFPGDKPARSCVGISDLGNGLRVEVEAIVHLQA